MRVDKNKINIKFEKNHKNKSLKDSVIENSDPKLPTKIDESITKSKEDKFINTRQRERKQKEVIDTKMGGIKNINDLLRLHGVEVESVNDYDIKIFSKMTKKDKIIYIPANSSL
jgi:hypothetical protein